MVNIFNQSIPTYYWNNLKAGTYAFKFLNLNDGEILTIKNKDDYFKYLVEYVCSNTNFYNNPKDMKIYLVLPYKAFIIGLNLYRDRRLLNKIKNNESLYVTIFKKNKKILRILELGKVEPKEEKLNVSEEFVK